MSIKKRDLIIVIIRGENAESELSGCIKFLKNHIPSDDFDAIILSPAYDVSTQIGRFKFIPLLESATNVSSFLLYSKFKALMKKYINVWCLDYSNRADNLMMNLEELGTDDIILQQGKNGVESFTFYGKSDAILNLLSYMEQRKKSKVSDTELMQRWQRKFKSPTLQPVKKR